MPKKQINYPAAVFVGEGNIQGGVFTAANNVQFDPIIAVHWDKGNPDRRGHGGHVAISVSEYPSLTEDEFRAATDLNPLLEVKAKTQNMSRTDINELVAALRKARDEAYGRDE